MSARSAVVLALLAPFAAGGPRDDEAWIERLFYPRLEPVRVAFSVTLEDLRGVAQLAPGERVKELREQIEEGDDDFDVQLRLASALLEDGEPEAAEEVLEELSRELREVLEDHPEDWELLARLGLVATRIGMGFRSREALNAALRLLGTARANDDELWLAPIGLAQLFLFQANVMRRADEEERVDEALERARRMSEVAIEIDDEEFAGHANLFLVALAELGRDEPDDLPAEMLERTAPLEDAAYLADVPEVAEAIAAVYFAIAVASDCAAHVETRARFEELADGDDGVAERLSDPEELVEQMAGLEGHHRLWRTAAMTRWWIAWHADLDDTQDLLDEAVAAARNPALVLEGAVAAADRDGREDLAEELAERLLEESERGRSLYVVGRLAARGGDHERAAELFEQAYEEEDLLEARAAIAISLLKQREEREHAIELLREVLDEDDELLAARFALGTALALEGEHEEAIEHLELALELAEDHFVQGYGELVEATLEEVPE